MTITNLAGEPLEVAVPSWHDIEFFLRGGKAGDAREPLVTPIAFSNLEAEETAVVPAGEALMRTFVLPLATREAGDARVFCVYRAGIDEARDGALPVNSNEVAFTVSPDLALERDDLGLVTRREAARVAAHHFSVQPESCEARLVRDERSGFLVWWVTANDSAGSSRSCVVDAYLARVKYEITQPVPPEPPKGKGAIEPFGGPAARAMTRASGPTSALPETQSLKEDFRQ